MLDIGCGTGWSTRLAARAAGAPGRVLGVDLSAAALERARRLTRAEGLRTVQYVCADAQTHPFEPGDFDVAVSSFGAMFFAGPVAGFTNVARALRPGGRLVMIVWQGHAANPWAGDDEAPFSLGDPAVTTGVLHAAGFAGVGFRGVAGPFERGVGATWVVTAHRA